MALQSVQVMGVDGTTYNVVGDMIGGVFYPIYKAGFGVAGVNALVSAGNPLPVVIPGLADPLPVSIPGLADPLPVQSQLVDESGVAYGVRNVDNKPRVSSMSYSYDIAEGNVPNHFALRKFGHNSTVGATLEEVWDGSIAYVYLTAAERLQVSSGDVDDQGNVLSTGVATGGSTTTLIDAGATFATDTVAPGDVVLDDTNVEYGYVLTVDSEIQITITLAKTTAFAVGTTYRVVEANDTGAAVIKIQGLDGNYNELAEFEVLATGASTVTTGSFIRVFRAMVLSAGATGANEGLISIRNNADAVLLAAISIGYNQTLMALWTVPDGFTAYLTSFYAATSSTKATEVHIYVRPFGGVFQIKKLVTIFEGTVQLKYDFPLPIMGRSDVAIKAITAGGGGEVSAGFDLWYEQ